MNVILIPGMKSDETLWAPQIDALESAGHKTYVYYNHDCDDIGRMADQLLAESPFEQFALFGTSMGGYVALETYMSDPKRVTHLGLLNSLAHNDTPQRARQRRIDLQKDEAAYQKDQDDLSHYNIFLAQANHGRDDIKTILHTASSKAGYSCFINHNTACLNRHDMTGLLNTISCPVMILGGDEDVITPPDGQKKMVDELPQARFRILHQCGHIATLEYPQEVCDEMFALMTQ